MAVKPGTENSTRSAINHTTAEDVSPFKYNVCDGV